MTKLYSSFKYLIGKILEKYYSFSLGIRILILYLLVLIPFLYFHEQHLPFGIILTLIIFALILALLLGLVSLKTLHFLFQREFQVSWELGFYFFNLVLYYSLGLFENRAGILLLVFCFLIYLPFRLWENRTFHRIFILGVLALSNALLTFQALRGGEWFLFHLQLKLQQQKLSIDLDNWEVEGKKITHKEIPIIIHLSENMFFHKPSNTLGEYITTRSLIGIISNSDVDPSIYPYLKIYFIPSVLYSDIESISQEFENYLSFEKNRGDIEALESIGEHILKEKYKGRFWIFYDVLRPKDVKTGFYIIQLKNGNSIILELRENLLEKDFHVKEIQEILDKIEIPE